MLKIIIIYIVSCLFVSSSYASIQVSKDKFFYKESDKEIFFNIKNKDNNKKYIIQSWVTNYNKEDKRETPFIITPSLIKLMPNEKFTLKIIKIDDVKEVNQESVYRVNIKIVPIADDKIIDKNILLVSLNSIYNLIYTPKNILKKPFKNNEIEFFTDKQGLIKVKNPTPYFITIKKITIDSIDILKNTITIPPFKAYKIEKNKKIINIKNKSVHWETINEYGERVAGTPKEIINEQ